MKIDFKIGILISSAGRRVELIQIWKDTIEKKYPNQFHIFTNDVSPELSAGCLHSDKSFKINKCNHENYIDQLLEQCKSNKIKIIIPTIDNELIVMSLFKKLFFDNGIHIVISDLELINSCSNKVLSEKFFNEIGIKYPRIQDINNLSFPCFIKPIFGSSSKGIKVVKNKNELSLSEINNKDILFQDLIPQNWNEYTADLYFSKDGYLKCCVPRERISTRAGEINKGITRKGKVYEFLKSKFNYIKGFWGVITVQLFSNNKQNDFLAVEINPRFGGGYPMSHAAGANYPDFIIRECLLETEIKFHEDWESDLMCLRFDQMITKSTR